MMFWLVPITVCQGITATVRFSVRIQPVIEVILIKCIK